MALTQDMFKKFLLFLRENKFPGTEQKILLTVSGGIDSVVMVHLFHAAGYKCDIAHCNFQLRGSESDGDELFVEQLAAHYKFDFHSKKFHTNQFAGDHSLSVQMAARNLRYAWFDELANKFGFAGIATAHHANDVAETMLINLVRGTGIAGMHGIPRQNGIIFRPLLFASRKEIENYAMESNLKWREDLSNKTDDYTRNKIRNKVIPLLEEINPQVIDAFNRYATSVRLYEQLTQQYMSETCRRLIVSHHEGMIKTIYLKNLLSYPSPLLLLQLVLDEFGFNETVCHEILSVELTGKQFHAPGYRLVRDRDQLTVFNLDKTADEQIYKIDEPDGIIQLHPGVLEFATNNWPLSSGMPADFRSKEVAYVDTERLGFPLKVRRWREGDRFQPLGMKGKKLISDFLTDEKISSAEKELVYLLLSGDEVVWVVGYRISDRFKVTEKTREQMKFIYTVKTWNDG